MKKLIEFLKSRWFIGALSILILSLIVWFLGPLLGFGDSRPFDSVVVRVVFIVLMIAIWLGVEIFRMVRAKRAADNIGEGILEQDVDETAERSAEEVAALKERFEEAVSVLRKTGSGKGKAGLYELPWYIIIGPPGSGKTTALRNSGLRFPLAEKFGNEALRGVGGTRNCDWWFTDEAILLDTAGRYTTQDSQGDVDRAAWEGFLDLLKSNRSRRPINGVIIAISLSDLMMQDDQERFRHARAIKQRVQELDNHFGIRLPVYVMLTKCDLMAGFMEFFEDLGVEDREQVWGTTFELSDYTDGNEVRLIPDAFDALLQRLESRVLARVSSESDPRRRGLIYGFPRQLASLKKTFQEFLSEVFGGSKFDQAPMLRGIYMTSGTQEGSPIDRIMGAMVRAFGIDQRQQPAFTGSGRSYFITRLLRDVIFPESEIAGTNRKVELRRAWMQRAAYLGIAGFLALAIVAWFSSYGYNQRLITDLTEAANTASEEVDLIPANDRDPVLLLPALNALRELPAGYAKRDDRGSMIGGFGLNQAGKLGRQADATYRRVMMNQLLPRIMYRLEDQVDRTDVQIDYTYEGLKAYLMLGSEEHYDPDAIEAWVALDWEDTYYGRLGQEDFDDLTGHLRSLLEARPAPLPIAQDAGRVAAARARLARVPIEQRIYVRMKNAGLADDLPGFNIRDAAGPNAGLVFVRGSGKALNDGLSPLFTRDGYDRVFDTDTVSIIRNLLAEQWVLRDNADSIGAAELPGLIDKVQTVYLDEYASSYQDLIYDVQLVSFQDANEAARILNVLSAADSPLLQLIETVKQQTTFSGSGKAAADGGEGETEDKYAALRQRLGGAATRRVPSTLSQAPRYANIVEEKFASLTSMTEGAGGGSAPIDYLMSLLRQLADFMMTVANEQGAGGVPDHVVANGRRALEQAAAELSRQGNPLIKNVLQGAAGGAENIAFVGLADQINSKWDAGPKRFCERAIAGRYPLDAAGTEGVRLEDFGEFFGFDGQVEKFFTENIEKYVDTTSRPWKLRRGDRSDIQLLPAAIRMFERADAIRNNFFRGNKIPNTGFELMPMRMDANINKFTLAIDGQTVTYDHGPIRAQSLTWPGPTGIGRVRIEMQPAVGTSVWMERGPWAFFKVLDKASLIPTDSDERFMVDFSIGGRTARYELVARSAFNPFRTDELHGFRCERSLTR